MPAKAAISVIAASISLFLVGCSSKERVLPQPTQTMQSIFEQRSGIGGMIDDGRAVLRRPLTESDSDLSPYVRSESDHLQARFKLLPNPTLYMFVAPHLSTSDRVPVPGYITEFKLYERDEYALPGEVAAIP